MKPLPQTAQRFFEQAGLLLGLDRDFEAIEFLRRGVALDPNPICLIRLAELELAFNAPDSALAAAMSGLQLDPSDAMGHVLAAKSLAELDRSVEAETHWSSAASLAGPDDSQVQLIRARHLLQMGQIDEALAVFSVVSERFPNCAAAHAGIAMNKRISEPEDTYLIRDMTELLTFDGLSTRDRIGLEYALGKSHDDLGRYEVAMRHFDRANEWNAADGFDSDDLSGNLRLRKEAFNRRTIERLIPVGIKSELPIFVLGMIRSGTTLAEQILACHPDVVGAGEQKFWLSADLRILDVERGRIDEVELGSSAGTYLSLVKRFSTDGRRVVDKQPGNINLAGALHMAFPNARIICLHRDLLDTAISIWATHARTSAPFVHRKEHIAFALREYEALRRHWREVLPADRFMEMSYESLILDRETSTRRLLDFCGLAWSDACMVPEMRPHAVKTPSAWQARQPVYQTSIGRWKHYEPWLGPFRQLQSNV